MNNILIGLAFIAVAVAGGFIVRNNMAKALAALQKLHDGAVAEIGKLRAKV